MSSDNYRQSQNLSATPERRPGASGAAGDNPGSATEGEEGQGEVIRDIELFINIYEYLDAHPRSSFKDIAKNVGRGLNPHKISEFVEQLEERAGGKKLIDRKPKSKNNSLTAAAKAVYEEGLHALRTFQKWPQNNEPDLIKIGVPNLLMHTVLPEIIQPCRDSLSRHKTKTDIIITDEYDVDIIINKISRHDLDIALVWMHYGNIKNIQRICGESIHDVTLEEDYFGVEFDVLMVCPPYHRFVKEAKESSVQRPVITWKVDLSELAGEKLYVLPAPRQPLADFLPRFPDARRKVEQPNYMSILSMIRCHVAEGVGLVPSVYPVLNEMRRKGQLFYAHVKAERATEAQLKVKIGVITRKGAANMSESASLFFETAKRRFERIAELEYQPSSPDSMPLDPDDYLHYKYCYFVMQQHKTFGEPRWWRGELRWGPREKASAEGGLTGEFTAETARTWEFEVEGGRLLEGVGQHNRQFQFRGKGKGENHDNNIICTFNMCVQHTGSDSRVIVGVWTGRDDEGLATVAPMVLSREHLDIADVRSILDKVSFRWLPNAEAEGKTGDGITAVSCRIP